MHLCLVGEWFFIWWENKGKVIVYLLCETSVEHPTSFVEASQKVKLKELSNKISDRSEAEGTAILSDLLVRSRRRRVTGKSAI